MPQSDFILSQIEDAVICTDAAGIVTVWNKAAGQVWGWASEEMLGRSVFDRLPVGAARAWGRERFDAVLLHGEESFGERHDYRKDGSRIWLEVRTTRLLDAEGRPGGLLTIARDITQRKTALAALHQSEEQFRLAIEHSAIGKALVAIEGKFLKVNKALCRIVGYTEEELMATDFQSITHPDDLAADLAHVRDLLDGKIETFEMEKRYFHKDGHVVWILLSVSLVRESDGRPRYFISQIQDITGRKSAEEIMRRDAYILSQIKDAVVCTNPAGSIIYWNDATEKLLGWTRAEVLGQPILQLFPTDERPEIAEFRQRVLRGEAEPPREWEARRKDGTPVWISSHSNALRDAEGRAVGIITMGVDITARRHAEETMRRHLQIFAQIEDCVICADFSGSINYWNAAATRLHGWTAEEMHGRSLLELFPQDNNAQTQRDFSTLAESNEFSAEREVRRKDQSRVWVQLDIAPFHDESGQAVGFVVLARDITERQRHVEKLRQSEAMMAAAQRLAHFGSWELDLNHSELEANELRWSDECYRIFGLQPGSVPVTNELFFSRVPPEEHEAVRQAVARAILMRGDYSLDHRIILPSNEVRRVHEQGQVQVDPETGEPVKLIGTIQDITERKQVLEELTRAKDTAEAATKAKSEFLAMISHEIRTPLNPILGAAQLLLDQECAPEQRELLQIIQNAGEHLLTLLSDILDLAKMEAGNTELNFLPCRMVELIRGVFDIKREDARRKQISLVEDLDENLAYCYLCDEARLRQVLLNFVGNSIKFTNQGSVTIRIERLVAGSERDQLRFAVCDTGIGLRSEHAQRIFEPFFQVDSTATRRFEGAGLGLAICRRLIEMMGGEVGVESRFGEGATFWFTMWLERRRSFTGSSAAPWPEPPPGGRRRRVLLVEDNEHNRVIHTTMLERAGCEVSLASAGADALALFRPGAFDLVLMDLRLPDLDGGETASLFRQRERTFEAVPTPIILQTNNPEDPGIKTAEKSGCNGCLIKPFRQQELVSILNKHAPLTSPPWNGRGDAPPDDISRLS